MIRLLKYITGFAVGSVRYISTSIYSMIYGFWTIFIGFVVSPICRFSIIKRLKKWGVEHAAPDIDMIGC